MGQQRKFPSHILASVICNFTAGPISVSLKRCVRFLKSNYTKTTVRRFRSIFETLVHIYQADCAWFGRIHGDPDSQTATYPPKPDLNGLANDWLALLDSAVEWSSKLSEAEWNSVISYKDSRGNNHQTAVLPIIMHVVNHGSYHRGQVSSLLRQSGATPPNTDLINFYRQAFAQKA